MKILKFTLMELLAVIAIMAILLTLLLPKLGQARYSATLAVCLSNLKQQYSAIALYANDNNRRYISRVHGGYYRSYTDGNGKLHKLASNPNWRSTEQTESILDYMGFHGDRQWSKGARNSVMCPLAEKTIVSRMTAMTWKDTDGDGVKEKVKRIPRGNSWSTTGYGYYFSTWWSSEMERPLMFLDQDYKVHKKYVNNGIVDNQEVGILMSDTSNVRGSYYISSHKAPNSRIIANADHQVSNDGYWTAYHGQGWAILEKYDANFLMTDGSANVQRGLTRETVTNGSTAHAFPLKFFE